MKKFLSLFLAVLVIISMLTVLVVYASDTDTITQNGLQISITTDRKQYSARKTAEVTVSVKNINPYTVKDVSLETVLPEALVSRDGEIDLDGISIAAGETYTNVLKVGLSDEMLKKETGFGSLDSVLLLISIATAVVVISLLVTMSLMLIKRHKKTKQVVSILLCIAISLSFVPIQVFAAEGSVEQPLSAAHSVRIGKNTYQIVAKVTSGGLDTSKDPSLNGLHTVTFSLNDGSGSAYQLQAVTDGAKVSKPVDPTLSAREFLGWYADSDCTTRFDFSTKIRKDTILYASWSELESGDYLCGSSAGGGTCYSVTGLKMVEKDLHVTINANSACTLRVQFLNEQTKSVITTAAILTPEYCELTPITIPISAALPEKYIIIACLYNSAGEALCNTYTCMTYTTAYENHAKQTVDDFVNQNVVNFDDNKQKNYGVLQDDVIEIISKDTYNRLSVVEEPIVPDHYDGTQTLEYKKYFVFEHPDDSVKRLAVGDKIYVKDTQHLIKIGTIENATDEVVVLTASEDVQLPDFYKVLNVDMTIDYNAATMENSGPMLMWDAIDGGASFPLGGTLTINPEKWLEIVVTLNGTGSVNVKMTYDLRWFEKDYFFVSVVSELSVNVKVEFNVTKDNEDDVDNDGESKDLTEISLGKWTFPTNVPGLTITTWPKIPVEWELKGGIVFDFTSKTTSGFSYSNIDGKQNIDKKDRTFTFGAEGEASIKAGPKIELSVEFCEEALKAKLSVGAGVKATGKVSLTGSITDAESKHACALCIDGKVNWYVEVNAGLTYKIIPDLIEGQLIDWDIVKLEGKFPMAPNFYLTIINERESVFNGWPAFGWGDCPNNQYRTEFIVKDSAGTVFDSVPVVVTNTSGAVVGSGDSKLRLYLYNGSYIASCTVDGVNVQKMFTVNGSAQTIELIETANGILSGKICRASDRVTAIPGAKIDIYKNGELVLTKSADRTGNYSIELPVGEYFVKITAAGYIEFSSYATVVRGVNTYMETFLMIEGNQGDRGVASGVVVNSLTGAGAADVNITFRENWNNTSASAEAVGTTTTDTNGRYAIELPIGNYTAVVTKDGFTEAFFNIVVQNGTTDNQNGTITPVMGEGSGDDYLITLTWGINPSDLDSHVTGTLNNGSSFHVYYVYRNQYENGDLICNLDYDDTTSYGPEHITLTTTTDQPYYYYIYKFAGSGYLTDSEAQVTVERGNTLVAQFNVPTNGATGRYWNVFAIVNGELVINNTITDSADTSYAG